LRLSSLLGRAPAEVKSVREVADRTGAHGPEFTPGDHFSYSDDGADTLGALIEVVSKRSLPEFLGERVLAPLGMNDAITVVSADHPLRARVASNYVGGTGAWQRYWSPRDPPLFNTLLASQSLYCSPRDYARFLALWEHRGKLGEKRLLRTSTCKRALAPGTVMGYPTGFEGITTHYGELWMLYVDARDEKELYAFGHNGSDGTFAWVFPRLELMVLCFTQSRGADIGSKLEAVLQRELVDPMLHIERQPPASYGEAELERVAGWYWNETRDGIVLIARKGATLEFEIPGRAAVELKASATRDRWTIAQSPDDAFEVERDGEGAPRALVGTSSKAPKPVRFERWTADPSWPSLDEVMALRKKAVDWDKLPALGVLQAQGKIDMPALKVTGTFTSTFVGLARYRLDLATNRANAQAVRDGESVWTANTQVSGGKPQTGDEATRERMQLASPVHVIVDWRTCFRDLRVVACPPPGGEGDDEGHATIVLRGTPERGRGRTLVIDAESGLLLNESLVLLEPGLGELGTTLYFDDWRAVEDVRLPFKAVAEHPTPLLGTYDTTWESVAAHVTLAPDFFVQPAPATEGGVRPR
jgi:CubicO group peptidase (beta-lactamase class C family)